jgi:predicted ATPase with chaperone activity
VGNRFFCQLHLEGAVLSRLEASKPDACGDIVLCMSQLNLSARAHHHILKLSRTIAYWAGSEEIESPHLAEAL